MRYLLIALLLIGLQTGCGNSDDEVAAAPAPEEKPTKVSLEVSGEEASFFGTTSAVTTSTNFSFHADEADMVLESRNYRSEVK